MTTRLAIIGAGRMGQTHYNNLRKFSHVEIAYVYDPHITPDKKSFFKNQNLCATLDPIIKDPLVKAVIIASPSAYHAELVEIFARAKKHIFCEKPVSFDLDILQKLKNIISQEQIILQVGFNRRFDPGIKKIRDEVANNSIGDIQVIKITNRDPKRAEHRFVKNSGGLFLDMTIHDFDTISYISGFEITEVYAAGDALVDPELSSLGDIDTAIITVTLSNQALAVIDCSRETGYGYDQQVEVLGSRGLLRLRNQRDSETYHRFDQETRSDKIPYSFVERYKESYRRQFEEFLACIAKKTSVNTGIDAAIAALKAAHAAKKSFLTQRSVS